MKILIPSDFSPLSKIAVEYAIELSKEYELEMVLLHVIDTSMPAMARLSSSKLEEVIKANAEKDMNMLVETIKQDNNLDLNLSSEILSDSSIKKGVERFAKNNEIDLICIGTQGATGLKKIFFGSNAAGIISISSIPVLTIPEDAVYKGVNKLVYSCDLENLEKELKLLIQFAGFLNSWVHILHINTEPEDFDYDLQGQKNRLRALFSFEMIRTKVLENDSIINGLNQYVEDIDADMVVMFTRNTALFDKLFKKSITKKAAFQTRTPLLTFQKG